MAKVPIRKKTSDDFKSHTLSEKIDILKKFKENNKIDNIKKKEQQWLILPKAFEDATQVVGLPLNTVSCVKGCTNSGKSTLVIETIKACQKQGILPVVFDLENAIKWDHARDVGVDVAEYVDEYSGEIVYGPSDTIMYFDTNILYERYGLYDHSQSKYVTKPQRETYVIEDVALCIRELIKAQRAEDLPFDLFFIIDSIGCSECYKSAVSSSNNNMWNAGAISVSFNVIVNDLIPSTLNVNSKWNNSMFFVNKIWTAMTPTGLPVAKEKGGVSLSYAARFSIFLGGQGSSGAKKMSLTYNGVDYPYAIQVKIRVDKNHVTNIERSGEICSTMKGLCSVEDLDEYKKEFRKYLIEELKEKTNKNIIEKDFIETERIDDE
jgi:hypothetical protein